MPGLSARASCVLRDTIHILDRAPGRERHLLLQLAVQIPINLLIALWHVTTGESAGAALSLSIFAVAALLVCIHWEVLRVQHRIARRQAVAAPPIVYNPFVYVIDEAPPPLPRRKSTEAIPAFRCWRLARDVDGYALYSTAVSHVWPGPVVRNEAPPEESDPQGATPAPSWGEILLPAPGHGFHGYRTIAAALGHSVDMFRLVGSSLRPVERDGTVQELGVVLFPLRVVGRIQLMGTVIVHEEGFRAQAAMVQELFVPPETLERHPTVIPHLERRYGCTVVENLEALTLTGV